MPSHESLGIFLATAVLLAITPGPGIFYVLARSLRGGRSEGIASTLGTAVGGMAHVVAAAFGLSALLSSSAVAFSIVKYAGAAYLVFLGIRTLLGNDEVPAINESSSHAESRQAFFQGIITEALNPKTALFFLAFIPQFINPHGHVALQFFLFGSISVVLNSAVDLIVAMAAGPIGHLLRSSARFRQRQRLATGTALIGLGAYAALTRNR
jgi:threonine/homoserine/homoserine lactone efflux protein